MRMDKEPMRISTTKTTVPLDREAQQAIVALKKGAQLLKYGRRGKPKFCPFRLLMDENHLLWYSGKKERRLSLDSVTKILVGQRTVNFQRQPQPEKECQSFSLIYADGERSLDLICKDKVQAETWCTGLRALITSSNHSGPLRIRKNSKGVQSYVNSPASHTRRKHALGIVEEPIGISQVRSLCASLSLRSLATCLSNGLPYSSNIVCSSEPIIADTENHNDIIEKKGEASLIANYQTSFPSESTSQSQPFPPTECNDVLRDILIWGAGMGGGYLNGAAGNCARTDSLLPILLKLTENLEIKNISFGEKHAALVARQGEVYCWGHEKGGRLGHKVNMDVFLPKIVETLNEVHVESVACGEYHTCALTHSGELYTWGVDCVGGDLLDNGGNRNKWWPQRISGPLIGIYVSSIACGEWHTAIVSSSGQLFTYGEGTFGVLGHGNILSASQPKEVESLKGLCVKSVACGPWHMAAVVHITFHSSTPNSSGGKLFTWGDGDKGKLGHLDEGRKVLPTCVARLVHYDFIQVSCGRMLTVGLMNTGKVCTIGTVANGQLGNSQAKDKSITIVEGKLKGEFVKGISSGSYHIAVLTSRGKVFTWGKGANGRLGLGDTEDRNTPTPVEALRDRQVESVVCGLNFTAAICVHESIFSSHQSSCSGCRIVFWSTGKKHNCYNCGFVFCRACSNKKVINASLAPNNNKLHRVCNSCYIKVSWDDETNFIEGQGTRKQHIQPDSPLPSELPRWGHVACPAFFHTSNNGLSWMSNSLSRNESTFVSPTCEHIALSTGSNEKKTNYRLFTSDEDGKHNSLAMTVGEVQGDAIEHRVGRLEKEILSLQTSRDRALNDVQDLVNTMRMHMDHIPIYQFRQFYHGESSDNQKCHGAGGGYNGFIN